jgi:hypothetical protein
MINVLALFLLFLGQNGNTIDYTTARFERKLQAVKASESITIDGRFDEPGWAQAPVASQFIQNEPEEGQPASEQTEIRVLYDQDNLYFAIHARDSEAGRVIISELRKDFNRDNGDSIVIALDTFHDERNAYQFATNPAGAKWDAQMNNEGRETNANWDGVWYVNTRVIDDGWTAEIAIPFKTLKFPRTPTQTWGINFQRNLRRRNEDSFWAPVPRIYGVQRVSLAGTLEGLEGIEPGSNVRIKPFGVSSFSQNGRTGVSDYDGDIGFDLKYGLTSGLTWDFTYRTDFSQAEADEQQINLTRYSLFFPEKREFFLENSGIFQFGSNFNIGGGAAGGGGGGGGGGAGGQRQNAVSNDLIFFHSRRIGLSEDADSIPIPILGGTRLTGRVGDYAIGILNIQQREQGLSPSTNFTVGRVRKNIFSNSDIGFMIANKELRDSNHYNRVAGGDANIRIGQSLSVNGYVAKAMGPQITSRDLAARFGFSYQDNTWEFNATYTSIQENFQNELGYVPRLGVRKTTSGAGYNWRPAAWRRVIRTIRPHWEFQYILDREGRIDTRYSDYHLPFAFQNGSFLEIGLNPSLEYLPQPFRISSQAGSIPAGAYKFNEYFFVARSDNSRRLSGNARWAVGEFYTGYKHSYNAGATWRHNYRLTGGFSYTHNNINLPEGHFKTNLLSTRLQYGFSTTMFVNALIQYNSSSQQWSSNIRFNIIHRPLSDIYIVYNERRNSISGNLVDRALIAKMTYMISR